MRYAMSAPSTHTSFRLSIAVALAILPVCLPTSASAFGLHPHRNSHAEQQIVEKLEDQIRLALLAGDAVALDKILADDFLGISANGTLSDKQQYMRRIGKREHQFSRIDVTDRKVRLQPASAIVVTTAQVAGKLDNVPLAGTFRYTRVYSQAPNGTWKLRNFEATRVSGNAMDELNRGTPILRGKATAKPMTK